MVKSMLKIVIFFKTSKLYNKALYDLASTINGASGPTVICHDVENTF